jgi:alanine racemase
VRPDRDPASTTTEKVASDSRRATWVDIDLDAIEHNARQVENLIGPGCELMAVVKADGYGLGARFVGEAAIRGGASWLGVACVDEGVALRAAGISAPILVMGYVAPGETRAAVRAGLAIVVASRETAGALEEAASLLGVPKGSVSVHVKIDTGLHRYGAPPSNFMALLEYTRECEQLSIDSLMTHFATADSEDLGFAFEQLERFEAWKAEAGRAGFEFDIVHAANSAATLALPAARYNLVRVGILLSGHFPAAHLSGCLPLRPAVAWKSTLARVCTIAPGESVGYGQTWVASHQSTIGLVPAGYADGYRRILSNRAYVLVGGRRCPVIGRVSMDQVTVDLTDVPEVRLGDEVVLIGTQGEGSIPGDEVASWADTISYEILTGISRRVPRRYWRNDTVVSQSDLAGYAMEEIDAQ